MASYSERPAESEYAKFYAGYVARVPAGDIVAQLRTQIDETLALLQRAGEAKADYAYAEGKWTIREVVGHLCDTERLLTARALRFARKDTTPLPGFDENTYVPAGDFGSRSLPSLVAELRAIRTSSVAMLDGLPAEAWTRSGTANNAAVTVRALAWIVAGHELHHRAILEERYLT